MLHERYPNKPILIAECGAVSTSQRTQVQNAMNTLVLMDTPYITGIVFWLYAQHPWPEDAWYAKGQKISPYGYMSRDRKTRYPALDVIEKAFKEELK